MSEIEKNIEEFWANIFHDLKAPMMSIHLVLSGRKHEDELLEEIYKLNATNLHFLQEFLENYNFKEGVYEYEIEPVSLNEILDEITIHLKYFLQEKNLKIEKIGFEKEYIIHFDQIGVSRVISNILRNAIKFSPRNHTILIEGQNTNCGTLLSITNYGNQIEGGMENEIFQKFKTTFKNSNGLGLFICKKLMDEAGGKIWAENLENGVRVSTLFIN